MTSAVASASAEPVETSAHGRPGRFLLQTSARRINEFDLEGERETDDEKAQSLVRAMLAAGLAEKL